MLVRTPARLCSNLHARDGDLRTVVPGIQIPALVLCGDEDLATPPALAQELATTLANASFALIEKAGHLPSIEQPSLLAGKSWRSCEIGDGTQSVQTAIPRWNVGSSHLSPYHPITLSPHPPLSLGATECLTKNSKRV